MKTDLERIKKVVTITLREDFPLFQEDHEVLITHGSEGICIGYRTSPLRSQAMEPTSFDVHVIGNIGYLLNIVLDKNKRGEGSGGALYSAIERFCREIGCSRVRMYPSGGPPTEETRRDYLKRRGYDNVSGNESDEGEVEKILTEEAQ
jgi:GNAT superfamily N-acetyltransferase